MFVTQGGGMPMAISHWPLNMLAEQCVLEKAESANDQSKINLPRISSMNSTAATAGATSFTAPAAGNVSSPTLSASSAPLSSVKHKRKLVLTSSHSHSQSRKQFPTPPNPNAERPATASSFRRDSNSGLASPPQSQQAFIAIQPQPVANNSNSAAPMALFAAHMRPIQEHSHAVGQGNPLSATVTRKSLNQRRHTNQLLPSIAMAVSQDNAASDIMQEPAQIQIQSQTHSQNPSALFNPIITPSPRPAFSPAVSSANPQSSCLHPSHPQPQWQSLSQSHRSSVDRHLAGPYNLAIDTHSMERRSADHMSINTPSMETNVMLMHTPAIEPPTALPTPFSDHSTTTSAAVTPSRRSTFSISPSAASASLASVSSSAATALANSSSITSLSSFFRNLSKQQKAMAPNSPAVCATAPTATATAPVPAEEPKSKVALRRNTFSFFGGLMNQSNSNGPSQAASPTPMQNPSQNNQNPSAMANANANTSVQELQNQMSRMVNSASPGPLSPSNESSPEIEISLEYKQGEVIGRGPHGKVYVCMAAESGEMFAIKVLKLSLDEETRDIEDYMAERALTVSFISAMRHKHFVNVFGFERIVSHNTNSIHYQLIMEHVAGRSVSKMLLKFGAFDERVIRSYSRQLVLAVRMLHHRGYVHGNIKSSSLLINRDGKLKLLELESVMTPHKAKSYGQESGVGKNKKQKSPLWTAPEVFQQSADFCSDLWSIACTIIEMAQVMPPWLSATEGDIRRKFTSYATAVEYICNSNSSPAIPSRLSELAKDFLCKCFHRDCRLRGTIDDLWHHPWLKGGRDSLNPSPMPSEDLDQPMAPTPFRRVSITSNTPHAYASPATATHSIANTAASIQANVQSSDFSPKVSDRAMAPPASYVAAPGAASGVVTSEECMSGLRTHNRQVAKDLLSSVPVWRHSIPHAHLPAPPMSGSIEEDYGVPRCESEYESDDNDETEDDERRKKSGQNNMNGVQKTAPRRQRGSIVRRGRMSYSVSRHRNSVVTEKVRALPADRSRSHSQSEAAMQ